MPLVCGWFSFCFGMFNVVQCQIELVIDVPGCRNIQYRDRRCEEPITICCSAKNGNTWSLSKWPLWLCFVVHNFVAAHGISVDKCLRDKFRLRPDALTRTMHPLKRGSRRMSCPDFTMAKHHPVSFPALCTCASVNTPRRSRRHTSFRWQTFLERFQILA